MSLFLLLQKLPDHIAHNVHAVFDHLVRAVGEVEAQMGHVAPVFIEGIARTDGDAFLYGGVLYVHAAQTLRQGHP